MNRSWRIHPVGLLCRERKPAHRAAPKRARFMHKALNIGKVAFLGDYLPRKCGIATFTTDLRCAMAAEFPAMKCLVVPINDRADYAYPPEVRFEIAEQDLPSYLRAADFLNITDVDAICLQHEFGIFG